jgi:hypothetical protein
VQVPLDFWNVSLWLAATSLTLLITAQLNSANGGSSMLFIDPRKLKTAALTMGILFLATVAIRIYTAITST